MLNNEEIEKLIEDMTKLRPEMLNEEALKLFNTIMKIIDERDTLIQERDYYKARYNALSKIVDLMAKHIYSLGYYDCLYEECDDNMDRECEDCIKEYFYKKVKETKDNGSTRNI